MRAKADLDPYYQDRSELREGDRAWVQHKSTRASVKDYSLKHNVSLEWDMNDDTIRNRILKLKIDDYEVLLSWEEMMRVGRWV